MMHQWESLQKLVQSWEAQPVEDPFTYEKFDFKMEEWDNVPPIIPRFQFYVQQYLSHMVAFSKEVRDRQTTL